MVEKKNEVLSLGSLKEKNFSKMTSQGTWYFLRFLFHGFHPIMYSLSIVLELINMMMIIKSHLERLIQESWIKKLNFEQEYAQTGWSVLPKICLHVASDLTREHHLMIKLVIQLFNYPPCQNNQVSGYDTHNIIDIF